MKTDERYNGWTNYATWRINLEILDDYANTLADNEQAFADVGELARHLQDYVDDVLTDGTDDSTTGGSLALDYARSFVSDVDWYEIAEHMIADRPEIIESDDEAEDEEGDDA